VIGDTNLFAARERGSTQEETSMNAVAASPKILFPLLLLGVVGLLGCAAEGPPPKPAAAPAAVAAAPPPVAAAPSVPVVAAPPAAQAATAAAISGNFTGTSPTNWGSG